MDNKFRCIRKYGMEIRTYNDFSILCKYNVAMPIQYELRRLNYLTNIQTYNIEIQPQRYWFQVRFSTVD